MSGTLFVISAPSGAGKTTLVNAVLQEVGDSLPLKRVVTYTTRSIGEGERAGVDYHFICQDEFLLKIERGEFLEWSSVYGSYYGTPASIRDEIGKGQSLILIIDRFGAQAVAPLVPGAVFIWIYTKSIDVLHKRLVARGRDSYEKIEKRLILAEQEIMFEQKKRFFLHHLCNDSFKIACNDLLDIIRSRFSEKAPNSALEAAIGD
jgi:guanylate kinase